MSMERDGRDFSRGNAIGFRAAALGHNATVEPNGKRFRIACSCGWRSRAEWNRKRTFDEVAKHCFEVVKEAGELSDTPNEIPGSVSGRN